MIYEITLNDIKYLVDVDDREARLKKEKLQVEDDFSFDIPDIIPYDEDSQAEEICTTMPGQVLSIAVQAGEKVRDGQTLLILESMKMENAVSAERDCTILEIAVKKGEFVGNGGVLFRVSPQ
ncbi:MAG: acetyl-CoA carboxylase biotin carboxyl carrier protein subunit, partial [Oscillospiraceae bacterium]|nr:acetyl-CoA carboxylase biotin carboxyl carrier protein subunit [Oscillospiraceae bacterium]